MNHDLVEMFKEKLDDLTISDYYGLHSPGLTCYLNSVLQVLFMTEDFREAVKQYCCNDSVAIDPHLGRLFSDLQKSVAKTHHVTKKLGITNIYEQRDAAEYFEKILCLTSPEAAKLFKGELNHKTTCHKCKERRDSRSFFWILPLVVEDSCHQIYSVEKGLKAFFKGEKVCEDNKIYCSCCNEKEDADFGCEITQSPEILTLLLKRFSFDYKRRRYVKLHCEVDVPRTLHMENCEYELYALVNHFGNLTGGHYTAQIRSFENQVWYHFNDDVVEKVQKPLFWGGDKSLRSSTAYLLMYRKVSRDPKKTDEALCTHSDVETEGRHNEAERGETPHHQLKNQSCNREKDFKHLNGDVLKRCHEPYLFGELEKQQNQSTARARPHREMLPQTGSVADGDSYKPSLRTQKMNSAKLQKDLGQKSHEPNRQQLDSNSEEHMGHFNTRGSPTVKLRTHFEDCRVVQNHESQKTNLKTSETVWETQKNTVAKTCIETVSLTRNRVQPSVTEASSGVRTEGRSKQRRETGVSANVYECDGYSSSSVPYQTPHSQSRFQIHQLTGYNYSPKLCRKSNSSEGDEGRMQHVTTADRSCNHPNCDEGRKTCKIYREKKSYQENKQSQKKPWR